MKQNKIGAIVVLYKPDINAIKVNLQLLAQQVEILLVVDNSSENNIRFIPTCENITYIPLMHNVGIAAAQNEGIRNLTKYDLDYVLFSDQDSTPESDTAEKLLLAFRLIKNLGIKVAATGTTSINVTTGNPYPPKTPEGEYFRLNGYDNVMHAKQCDAIPSSISLLELEVIKEIGGFDESLFIDGVDYEWCWRAAMKGYHVYCVKEAPIKHMLGEGDHVLHGRHIAISSPFRCYYQYRNYLWLLNRDYVPTWWKRKHLFKYMVKFFYYPLFSKPHLPYITNMLKGISDGILKTNIPNFEL